MGLLREVVSDARRLGLTASARFLFSRRAFLPIYMDRVLGLEIRRFNRTFWFRHGTSDKYIIREVFKAS